MVWTLALAESGKQWSVKAVGGKMSQRLQDAVLKCGCIFSSKIGQIIDFYCLIEIGRGEGATKNRNRIFSI